MATRRRRFAAEVRRQGVNPYVEVPRAVSDAFAPLAEHGRIRVHGTLEGAEIRGTLVPREGVYLALVLASVARARAKSIRAAENRAVEEGSIEPTYQCFALWNEPERRRGPTVGHAGRR